MKNNKFFSLETTFMFWGCITYPVLVSFYAFLGSVLLQVVSLVIGVSIFSIMFYRKNRISYQQKILLLFVILFLILFGAYAAVWTGMRNYGVILFLLSGIGIAWASLELNITKYVYEYPFYIFLIVTLVLIANGFDRNSFNSLLDAGSRNVYSAILIAFAFGYLLSKTLMRSSPSLILGLLLIFSSFILYSRTGLFLSFIFFIIILLQNKSFIKFKVFILLLSIILAIALGVGDLIKDYSNFSKGLESARYEIWRSYVSDINLVSLFFGSNLNYNELIMEFNGNPHSAFLRMHAYFGFGFCS
jgi:hypothetical protein